MFSNKLLRVAIFSAVLVSAGSLPAQIQLTSQDILGLIGKTIEAEGDTTGAMTVNVGSPGANQIWDFTDVSVTGVPYSYEFLSPAGTPFADDFPSANFVEKFSFSIDSISTNNYAYHVVTPSALTVLGSGFIFNEFREVYFEENDTAPLPLTYGSQWTATSTDTLSAAQGLLSLVRTVTENTVDGWGTLKLPVGDFQTLRLKSLDTEISETTFNGVPVFADTTHSISYTWIAGNVLTLVAIGSQEDVTDPNFTEAGSFVWSTDDAISALGELTGKDIPSHYRLEQNYPNPFNPVTRIGYSVPRSSQVELNVYDISGQVVATLVDGNRQAGNHSVEWNAAGLPSGVYFCRLSAENTVQTRKMMLVK